MSSTESLLQLLNNSKRVRDSFQPFVKHVNGPETHELKALPSKYGPRWCLSREEILIKFLLGETACSPLLRTPFQTTINPFTRVNSTLNYSTEDMHILSRHGKLCLTTDCFMQLEIFLLVYLVGFIKKEQTMLGHPF